MAASDSSTESQSQKTSPSSPPTTTPVTTTASSRSEDVSFSGPFAGTTEPIKNASRPSIAPKDSDGNELRRQSTVQFNVAGAESTIRRESLARQESAAKPQKRPSTSMQRRMSSPPPPNTYQRGVSFDTFNNRDATDFSLTLQYKHKDYRNTRRSRTFLCGTDQKDYSDFALEWLLDELVDDGDEIVCLKVVEKDSKIASDISIQQRRYRLEAQELLDQVIAKNKEDEKAISLVMELAVGKVQEIIQRMIQIYEPAILIVGTRGKSLGGVQGLLPGSISKYCLQQSPIPVVVVRPESKRIKKKKKRLADPSRRNYNTLLEKTFGGLDASHRSSFVGSLPDVTDQEAEAVAKAIGLSKNSRGEYGTAVRRRKSSLNSVPADIVDSVSRMTVDSANKALQSPVIAALDWSSDSDDGVGKSSKLETKAEPTSPVARRSSSVVRGEDPPWLKAILEGDKKKY